MVHVYGRAVSERVAPIRAVAPERRLMVPVDVGKSTAMALVADASGQRRVAPFTFTLDRPGLADLVARVSRAVIDDEVVVEVGVEAAGHYHRPVTASGVLPAEWNVVELNPAHVTEQRRVNGKRGIKTDQIDLAAMFDLMVAGRGHPTGRRDGAALAGADTARVMLAADLALLDTLDTQVAEADTALAELLPQTPFQILTTTPGWGSSGRPATAPRSVTPTAGPARVRSTGPRG